MSIRSRIIIVLIPVILVLLGVLTFVSFSNSEKTVLQLINYQAHEVAKSRVMEFDVFIEASQKIAEGIATSISTMPTYNKNKIDKLLIETLKKNRNAFGSTVSFIPDATNLGSFAPYYYQKNNKLIYTNLSTNEYNYPHQNWFLQPLKEKKGVWSEPYFDKGGGDVLMVTYSAPIVDDNNKYIGVSTVDISIDNIVNKVQKLTVSGQGYAFIVTKDGKIIAHPKYGALSEETLYQISKKLGHDKVNKLISYVKDPNTNFVEIMDPFNNTPSLLLTTGINSVGWTLVIIYPRDNVLQPITDLKYKVIIMTIAVILILVVLISWLSSSLTSPITKLVKQTELYSQGILNKKIDELKGPKEIRQLSRSFNLMGQAIIDQIENVKKTTAQKERYQQELHIAAEIQQSILPRTFPPFADLENIIDLYGTAKPAKEIGGDFYDFFKLPNDRIGIVIADVSDKGAPASFFMAMTRMLVREIAERGLPPAEVLRKTNYMLALDNEHSMFVTLIYCEYHVNTGFVKFVCAGHNPPLYISTNREIKTIQLKTNLPLGVMTSVHYETDEFMIQPGDTLILYTDGVTEASDVTNNQYGLNKLVKFLNSTNDLNSTETVNAVIADIEKFTSSDFQHDDITMICLKRKPTDKQDQFEQKLKLDNMVTIRLPAKIEVLELLTDLIKTISKNIGFNENKIYQINLAIDEIVTNIITHSYRNDSKETFQIEMIPRTDGLYVCIYDYGIPFNFDENIDKYNQETVSVDQPVGGIGLHLAKQSVDQIWYESETIEGNKTAFIKYL